MAKMKRKVVRGLENEEYHRGDKYRGYISSSMIKKIAKEGIYAFANQDHGKTSKSLDLGTAAHTYFFEHDSYDRDVMVLGEDKLDGRTADGKAQAKIIKEIREENSRVLLFPHEQRVVENIWDNFKKTYPDYANMFRRNQNNSELSMFVENWRGHRAKIRIDHLGESKVGATIFDLKTTFDEPTPQNVAREIRKWQYAIQDVMYTEVANVQAFVFVFVKTAYPYTVQCYQITNEYLRDGADLQIRYALEKYEEYKENPDLLLPTYSGEIEEV